MKSPWVQNQLSEKEFQEGVLLLEAFIAQEADVEIYEWFSICDTYIYMLDKKIINPKKFTRTSLLDLCGNVDVDRFQASTQEDEFEYRYRINFYDNEVSKKFYLKKEELDTLKKDNENSQFSQDFQMSWANIQDDVYQNKMHTPIFQNISVDVVETAFRNWSNEDVFQFVRFVKQRYKFSNIIDFFEAELEALKSLSSMVDNLRKELGVGLKVASLADLYDSLVEAYSRMEKQKSKKEKSAS